MRSGFLLALGAAALMLWANPAAAQAGGKSMSYGTIRCDSLGRESTCPIDTRGGVSLSREFSRGRCIEGRTWGYDAYRIWVSDGCQAEFQLGGGGGGSSGWQSEVTCESRGSRQSYCDADTRGGVELIRQLSNAACVRDRTWGYDRRGIWVSDGCRASFGVRAMASGGGQWNNQPINPPNAGGGRPNIDAAGNERVFCQSGVNRRTNCAFSRPASNVQLVRDMGRAQCFEGQNWNWDTNGLWVENSCAGEFVATARGNFGSGGPYDGNPVAGASVVCESHDNRVARCALPGRGQVQMVRQLSRSACVEGQSWGHTRGEVWVSGGCRAEFALARRR